MEFIIVENGIITEHGCAKTRPENAITVPDGFSGYVGLPFKALKDDLSGVKPLQQQVEEGIIEIPEGYKINRDGTDFIKMEQDEIDEKYPAKFYAKEGLFESIRVGKTFDGNGNFDYFPPEDLIEMDGEQPSPAYKAVSGKWVPDIDKAKEIKLSEINSACDEILNSSTSTYPDTEVLTFDQQKIEAKAYKASGNVSDAPLLSALATGRGIALDDLVQRVIAKSDAFTQLSGYVIGKRQALEDRLDACMTVEEIENINVDFTT